MSKNIIITCGTSIFTNLLDEDFYGFNGSTINYKDFKNFKEDVEKLSEKKAKDEKIEIDCDDEMWECEIEEKLKKYLINWFENIDTDSQFFRKLSAEITLITKLDLDKEKDSIYLLYSDTLDGQLVVEVLEYIFKESLQIKNLFLEKIDGFVVKWEDGAQIFRKMWIKNFYQKLEQIKKNWNETIMCPVGGYKAIIPYASLYAMVQGWDIKYIYEDSDELMDLPSGMLSYLLIKWGIKDKDFQDVIEQLEKWENSIFSQDVKEFENIVKLIEATNRFVDLGDLSGFAWIEFKKLEDANEINKLLEKFTEFDTKIKFGQIREQEEITGVINEINEFVENTNILSPIFNELAEQFEYFETKKTEIDFYFSILSFYEKHNMYLQWFLFMREFFIDLVSYFEYKEIKNCTGDREYISKKCGYIETNWNKILSDLEIDNFIKYSEYEFNKDFITNFILKERRQSYHRNNSKNLSFDDLNQDDLDIEKIKSNIKSNIKSMWNNIREIRNYFAHYKFSDDNKFSPQNLQKTFEEYYNLLESFKNHILNNQTPN